MISDNKSIQPYQERAVLELSPDTIKKYVNPLASDQEIILFYELCKVQGLNPFLKEAYLIKYDKNASAQFVVGKDVFTKRADQQEDFEGFEAGIVLINEKKEVERRPGTLLLEGEKVVGG